MNTPTSVAGLENLPRYIAGSHHIDGFPNPIILSANENPRGPSPKAIAALQESAQNLHRYPSGDPSDLKASIAEFYQLDDLQGEIILGAGSDEIISLLAKGFAHYEKTVIMSQFGFLMYPIASQSVGANVHSVPERDYCADVDALLASVNDDSRLMFLANPNNPTGSYLPNAEIHRLVAGLPDHVLLVLDCAYSEYVAAPDYSDHHDLVATGRVCVTHTFSKVHGLAGVRLGWAFVPSAVADIYERLRSPFNITAPSIAAGIAALQDRDYLTETLRINSQERDRLMQSLAELSITVLPSVGNFLLLEFASAEDAQHGEKTLRANGIIGRGVAGYGLPHCLRISIGLPDENTAVLAALTHF